MVDSAQLKLDRAMQRIRELDKFLDEQRPFRYILETNHQTGQRATYAKCDEAVAGECALLCGEVLQNLRSALDFAYWAIVSPFATTPSESKSIQFPFSRTSARLEAAVRSRFADRVGDRFFAAVVDLKPHGEVGGNRLLYLIDELNVPEKHRELTPILDHKYIDCAILVRQVSDLPVKSGRISMGGNHRDITWSFAKPLGAIGRIFEQEIDYPLSIVFPISLLNRNEPVITMLTDMFHTAHKSISIIRSAA